MRRWPPSLHHVFCRCGLPDIDAELEQFAVDPRRSPKRVRYAHLANELANFSVGAWPTTARLRLPAPIGSKPSAMPTDQRLGLEDFQRVQNSGSQAVEPGKTRRSRLLKATRFGDLRRSTLSWCRRIRISVCNAARDRNSPTTAHRINLQRSPMAIDYYRFSGNRQPN